MDKLKVGMIGGGGVESFFGKAHLRAVCLDGTREVVAGALRSNPESALAAAREWGIRGFQSWEAMIDTWLKRDIQLD